MPHGEPGTRGETIENIMAPRQRGAQKNKGEGTANARESAGSRLRGER